MKPFTLESVLKYRLQLENIAKNRLYEAEKMRAQAHQRLQDKEAVYQGLIADLAALQSGGIEVDELIRYENRITLVHNEIVALKAALAEREKVVIRERENTVKKSKERKIMEKLKDRQNAAWQQHLNKKEAALLDEIAVIFHER